MAISSSSGAPIISASYHLLAPLGLPNFPADVSEFYAKVTAPNATTPTTSTPPIPDLINAAELSRRTKLSLKTVRNLARTGRISSVRIGRRIFFPASALMPKNTANHPDQAAGVNTNYNRPLEGDK